MSQYSAMNDSNRRPEQPRARHSFPEPRNASQERNGHANNAQARPVHPVYPSDHGDSNYPRQTPPTTGQYHPGHNNTNGVQPEPQALGGIPSSVAHLLDPNAVRKPPLPARHVSAPSNAGQPRPQPLNFEYDRPAPYTHSFGLPTPPGSVQVSVGQQQNMPMQTLQPPAPAPAPPQQAPAPAPRIPSINEVVDQAFAPLRSNVESIFQAAQNHMQESLTRMRDEYTSIINDSHARNQQLLQMMEKKEYGFQHVVDEVDRLQKEVAEHKLGRRADALLIEDLRKKDSESQHQLEKLRKEVEDGNAMIGEAAKYVGKLNAELEKLRQEKDRLQRENQSRAAPLSRPPDVDAFMRVTNELGRARVYEAKVYSNQSGANAVEHAASSTMLNRRPSGSAPQQRRDIGSSPQMLANVPALSRNTGISQPSPIDTKSLYNSGQERPKSAYSPSLQRSNSVDDASRVFYQSSPTESTPRQEVVDMNAPNRRASVMRSSSAASIPRTNSPLNPSSSRHYYRNTPNLNVSMAPPLSSSSNSETRKRSREDSSPQEYTDGSSPVERPAIRVKTEDSSHITDSVIASSPLPLDSTEAPDSNAVAVKKEPGQEAESEALNNATLSDTRGNRVSENQAAEEQTAREADLRRLRQEEEERRIAAIREANLQRLRKEHEEKRILEEQKRQRQVAEEQAMIIEKEAAARSAAARSAPATAPRAQVTPIVDYSRPIPPPYHDDQENASLEDKKRKQQQQQQQQQQVTESQAKTQAESEAAKVATARADANPPEVQRSPYYRPQLYANGPPSSQPPPPSHSSPQLYTQPPRRPTFNTAIPPPVFAAAPPSEPALPPAPPKLGLAHFDLLYKQESTGYVCKMCMTRRRSFLLENPSSSTGGPPIEKFPKTAQMDELVKHSLQEHPKACEDLLRMKPSQIAEMKQRMTAGGM